MFLHEVLGKGAIVSKYPLIVHISFGGPEYRMQVGRTVITFEEHRYFGPVRMDSKTGTQHEKEMPKRFWPMFERWQSSGKHVGENGLCVVPEACNACFGTGLEVESIGGKDWLVIGEKCKSCNGRKMQS